MFNEMNFLKIDDFELGRYLGSGQFGHVWLVKYKKTGHIVALKILEKEKIVSASEAKQLRREIEIHSKLKQKNILRMHGFFYDKLRIYLILEFAGGGELFDILQRSVKFNEALSAKYILQVAKAIYYMQLHGVIHRDIKPENILIGSDDCVKIADFGWAVKNIDCKRYTFCGTLEYLAPEMLSKKNHNIYLDVWCLGILTFEFLTGKTPFYSSHSEEAEFRSKIEKLDYKFPIYLSEDAKDFISKLLIKDPEKRLKIEEVPAHPWIIKNVNISERRNFFEY